MNDCNQPAHARAKTPPEGLLPPPSAPGAAHVLTFVALKDGADGSDPFSKTVQFFGLKGGMGVRSVRALRQENSGQNHQFESSSDSVAAGRFDQPIPSDFSNQ